MQANGLPSQTSILTAAARALGSREPDASVRNPDWAADRLIGPAELALITDHPISKALDQDFQEAMNDPDVFGFVWLMLVRTRYIDERLERAVRSGATQVVILGAGFDTRAHRFTDLLKDVPVIEVDYGTTQEYKKRRVEAGPRRTAVRTGNVKRQGLEPEYLIFDNYDEIRGRKLLHRSANGRREAGHRLVPP